jgi:hypothetical protein
VAALVVVLALAGASMAVVYLNVPRVAEPQAQPQVTRPPVVLAPPPSVALPATPSRSRGHGDWLFFFRPGDWLSRMADDALLGVVIRLEKTHTFTDGSTGPAYVVQSMEGEERVVDADELERNARLR